MYSDLLLHNRVRWLSRGEVLKRFAACLEHVKTFLGNKGLGYPELEDPSWLEKFYFMVDMTSYLNMLNKNLQGQGSTALHMLEEILAFERKMTVFARDVQNGTLSHFPSLREFKEANNHINCDYFHRAITAMQAAFEKRFSEFRKEKQTLSFPVAPLNSDPSLLNTSAFTGRILKKSSVRGLLSLKSTNGVIWKNYPNPTNLFLQHGMPFPTPIST
ncbi:protein FAM200C-like [Takifugu flavidus]|uniref:protein FAM200C-like n=1 Tax=Takifugu flavidus TaxID=433684 RepID=UPI002544B8FB|nr:protein FAM200C-like [Takifugu flavidus]